MRSYIISALILALASFAGAHAFLDHADPRVGSTVKSGPPSLRIWFTQAIEPVFTRVRVFNSAGQEVGRKDAHVDPRDRKLLVISLPKLSPGTYRVSWSVVSVDTHRTQGEFKFNVKPG